MFKPTLTYLTTTHRQVRRHSTFVSKVMAQTISTGGMPSNSTKLTGRAFYESIGSPKYIVAPMVDRSEFVRPPSSLRTLRHMLTRSPGLETPHSLLPG